MVLRASSICPEIDKSVNMRRIINSGHSSYEFSRLAGDEKEADIEVMGAASLHSAADDWDEFLGDKNKSSTSSSPSPADKLWNAKHLSACKNGI